MAASSTSSLPLLQNKVRLNTGALIPQIGLGVFEMEDPYKATLSALALGYRHIDTAVYYENEAQVGKAIRDSGVRREDIFVTTKVWIDSFGYEPTLASGLRSHKDLNCGPIDLLLLHAPVKGQRLDSYRALEELHRRGICKAIGVSNYGKHHLEELLANCTIPPAVNQIELHPFLLPEDVLQFCSANGILIEAYSPLTKGQRLKHPALQPFAKSYGRSVAQIMIRWCYQHGFVVLPKSDSTQRQKENADIDFAISAEDMKALDDLARKEQWHCTWNPLAWE